MKKVALEEEDLQNVCEVERGGDLYKRFQYLFQSVEYKRIISESGGGRTTSGDLSVCPPGRRLVVFR